MFPTFLSFTQRRPRLSALVGVSIAVMGVLLWLIVSQQNAGFSLFGTNSEEVKPESLLVAPDATNPQAVEEYEEYVEEFAVETQTIAITENCTMDPLIIKMKASDMLKIENRDLVKHVISFEDQNFFSMAAGQVREFNVAEKFAKGPGIYRYRCNDVSREDNVGVMYFIE